MLVSVTRNDITEQIVLARLAKGLTWQELADAVDRPVVWTTAALLGQHPIPPEIGRSTGRRSKNSFTRTSATAS
jgi:cyanate lyase